MFVSTEYKTCQKTFYNSLCGELEQSIGKKPRSFSEAESPLKQTMVFITLIIGLKKETLCERAPFNLKKFLNRIHGSANSSFRV